MIKIGLTGGIASGKSTIAKMLHNFFYIPIFDADKAVHQLYHHPDVAKAMELIVPNCVNDEGKIERKILSKAINDNPDLIEEIEDFIHPLVRSKEQNFSNDMVRNGCGMIISEIPLLFESNAQDRYDMVVVAHAPLWLRKKRAMHRHHMNEQKWRSIIANQTNDSERLKKADFIIRTGLGKAHTACQVKQFMARLK
jgi:dephospho-CoA kinase